MKRQCLRPLRIAIALSLSAMLSVALAWIPAITSGPLFARVLTKRPLMSDDGTREYRTMTAGTVKMRHSFMFLEIESASPRTRESFTMSSGWPLRSVQVQMTREGRWDAGHEPLLIPWSKSGHAERTIVARWLLSPPVGWHTSASMSVLRSALNGIVIFVAIMLSRTAWRNGVVWWRRRHGRCVKCCYPTIGRGGKTCPECGTVQSLRPRKPEEWQ
jgi:hypothetical protein